jgi:hypothetical protein
VKRFHEQMLDNARLAVREIGLERREIIAATFSVGVSDLAEAKQVLRKFRSEFCRRFERDKGDSVYQLEVAFFPLTEIRGGRGYAN